jgi:hypothetical protein
MQSISSLWYLDTYIKQKEGSDLLPSHIECEPPAAVQLLVKFLASKYSALSEGQGTPSHSPAVTLSVADTSVCTVQIKPNCACVFDFTLSMAILAQIYEHNENK